MWRCCSDDSIDVFESTGVTPQENYNQSSLKQNLPVFYSFAEYQKHFPANSTAENLDWPEEEPVWVAKSDEEANCQISYQGKFLTPWYHLVRQFKPVSFLVGLFFVFFFFPFNPFLRNTYPFSDPINGRVIYPQNTFICNTPSLPILSMIAQGSWIK